MATHPVNELGIPPVVSGAPTSAAEGARAPARGGDHHTARVTSEQLFAGAVELQIEHHGALYRLKQTSLGKLILTK